jgi:hypothetical protein
MYPGFAKALFFAAKTLALLCTLAGKWAGRIGPGCGQAQCDQRQRKELLDWPASAIGHFINLESD